MELNAPVTPALLAPAAHEAPASKPGRLRRLVRRIGPLVLLWSIPGLISSNQSYWLSIQREPDYSFWSAFFFQYPPWQFWALSTPAILALGRRLPPGPGNWASSIAGHLGFNLVLAVGHSAFFFSWGRLVGQPWFVNSPMLATLPMMVVKNSLLTMLAYWGTLAAGLALEYRRRHREEELARAHLETQLAQAQLDALKMQLHPHFLFNTLNAIAVLVRKQDTPGAIRMLTGVSELLRAALHNAGQQHVPLQQELAFLDRYLDIEQTRFQDRLRVQRHIEPGVLDVQVPNLLLQPLVENAIKHGIAPRAAAGRVELHASRRGDRLHLEVRDDGPGLRPGWETGEGIGVANVRARLRRLYGEAHSFSLENHPEGGVRAVLELPFQPSTPESRA